MNRKSVIENRSSRIWHFADCGYAPPGDRCIYRCQVADFKIPNLNEPGNKPL